MITRLRLLALMVRPAVFVLLMLYLALGSAQAGGQQTIAVLIGPVVAVVGFLLFSLSVNDLADEAIDRVNLPHDEQRMLVSGRRTRSQLALVAGVSAAIALAAAASVGWQGLLVICCGLVVSAAYSLPPTRICGRGAVAALVLPACFVVVPYLLAVFAATGRLSAGDLVLLLGLYVGFIGRILLKDFRDVRGDALFGKRTFLVRHGRSATCRTSAVLWVAGSLVILLGVQNPTRTLAGTFLVCLAVSLWLLRVLAVDQGPRRDEAVISAIAVVGRGMMLIVLAHLGMTNASWSATASAVVLIVLTAITMGQAREMFRHGPRKAEVEIPGSVSLAGPQERSPTATTP